MADAAVLVPAYLLVLWVLWSFPPSILRCNQDRTGKGLSAVGYVLYLKWSRKEVLDTNRYFSCAAHVVQSHCAIVSGCIMTYGQTGSGKTFTMSGDSGNYQVPCHEVENSINITVIVQQRMHTSDIWSVWSVWSVWSISTTVHDIDLSGQRYPWYVWSIIVHVAGLEAYNLHDLGQVSCVGSVLQYTDLAQHLKAAGQDLDDLYDVSDLSVRRVKACMGVGKRRGEVWSMYHTWSGKAAEEFPLTTLYCRQQLLLVEIGPEVKVGCGHLVGQTIDGPRCRTKLPVCQCTR